MPLQSISQADFLEHLQQVPEASFTQSSQMATLLEKRGCRVDYLGYIVEGELQVSTLLYSLPMTGGIHMEINGGPIHTDSRYLSDFYRELQNYAKSKGALELIIKPYDTYQDFDSNGTPTSPERPELIRTLTDLGYKYDGLQTGYPGGEPTWHYVKDLTELTAETLFKSYHKKGQRHVTKNKKIPLKIRSLERTELDLFKHLTSSTSQRQEFEDKSLDYYQDFYDSFGQYAEFAVASLNFVSYLEDLQKEQAELEKNLVQIQQFLHQNPESKKKLRDKKQVENQLEHFKNHIEEVQEFAREYGNQDTILAGGLFIYSKHETIYLFGGSYHQFSRFYAPTALQSYAMQQSIKRQIPLYNFLGITGQFDNSDGVLRFKQNFNGRIVRKMGTFRYYPHPLKYKTIQGVKKLLRRS